MSAEDLRHIIEDAENAAKTLRSDLRKAKALVEEARERLERQAAAAQLTSGASGPVTEGGQP